LIVLLVIGFSPNANARTPALFEPPPGKQLFIVGQDLGAIGGFAWPRNRGYVDGIPIAPAGVTTYLSLPRLAGMEKAANLGSGVLNAQAILANPRYAHAVLAIGLHFVGKEKAIADGEMDAAIQRLADWIRKSNRPVFLRIGYEFDGSWNHYDPENYRKAFRRIVEILRERGAKNCAMVWQSATSPVNGSRAPDVMKWYPGDDYVDWFGYSWFLNQPRQIELTDAWLALAAERGKPVMVCESAPQGYDLKRLNKRSIFRGKNPQPKTAEQIWAEWYEPFFAYVNRNRHQIRAVAYINANWNRQLMWGWPYSNGYWGDSRVQVNPVIREKWLAELSQPGWMRATPSLFSELHSSR